MTHKVWTAHEYQPSFFRQTLAHDVMSAWHQQRPWLGWVRCGSKDRAVLRQAGQSIIHNAMAGLNLRQDIQISTSYARDVCLFGLSLGKAGWGLDLVDLAALKTWSAGEFDDVAQLYFSLSVQESIKTSGEARLRLFAQEWASYEARVKATQSAGIDEKKPLDVGQVALLEGLPQGFLAAAVLLD